MEPFLIGAGIIFGIVIGGAVGGYLGAMKNRETEGILFGAALGFIGWFIVLLLPDGKEELQAARPGGKRENCPTCGIPYMVRQRPDGTPFWHCPRCD